MSVLHFPFSPTFQREIFQKKKKKNCLSKFRSRRFLIHEEFAIFALLIFYTANNSVNNFFNFNFNFDFDRGDFHFGYFFREIEKNS